MALRENRSNRSYIWLAVALLIFMVLVAYYARSYRVLQDDAYISLRYADNLVHGHGLTFNVGDRVEGYSNFLWVILMAGAVKLGIHPVAFVKVVGVLSGLLLVLAVWRFSEDFSQLPPRLRVAAPLVAVAGRSAVWRPDSSPSSSSSVPTDTSERRPTPGWRLSPPWPS
jgi:hypothetical protein